MAHTRRMSEQARQTLKANYVLNAIRNEAVMAEVLRVTAALEEAGITAVPLKGAGLIGTLYSDPALRTLSDVDLLVPRKKCEQAAVLLGRLGYEPRDQGLLRERALLFHHHLTFHRAVRPVALHLELHHRLVTGFLSRDPTEEALGRAAWGDYGGGKVRRLDACDELLYLCAHLAAHLGAAHLKWLVDLGLMTRAHSFDWNHVLARVLTLGLGIATHEALRRAVELCDATVPAWFLDRLRPGSLLRRVIARLAPIDTALGEHAPGKWPCYALAVLLQEGVVDKVLFAGSSVGYKVWLERWRRGV